MQRNRLSYTPEEVDAVGELSAALLQLLLDAGAKGVLEWPDLAAAAFLAARGTAHVARGVDPDLTVDQGEAILAAMFLSVSRLPHEAWKSVDDGDTGPIKVGVIPTRVH